MIRVIEAEEVHRLCAWEELMHSLAEAHRGPEPLVDRSELHRERRGHRETYFNLPAWQPGVAMGTKLVTVFPGNPTSGPLPAVQALYALFDGEDGRPLALFDGTALTYRKTAADSALGARLLARSDARVLLMVGAGALAPYLIDAHRAARPEISEVLIWNRNAERARVLAGKLGARAVDDLGPAVAQADIVSCATASTVPLIEGRRLAPGAHLDLVGGFTPEMRECDDDCVTRSSLFVDSRWFAIDQPGDLSDPIRRGVITKSDIRGDLFDLCRAKRAGRRSAEEITLFKNGGGAHLDLFTALHVWKQVR